MRYFSALLLLVAFAGGCGRAPLEELVDGGADLARPPGDLEIACRSPRFNWLENDGGPACCGGDGARCCAGADPCDPGLRCVLNYTSTCWKDFLGDGGGAQ